MVEEERASDAERRPHRASEPESVLVSASEEQTGRDESASTTVGQHLFGFAKELLIVVVGAIIVASLLRGFVGQMFIIPSGSMENTLQVNDRVAVEKISTVKRGEVVVFANPGGWLTGTETTERGSIGKALEFVGILPDTGTDHLIKRVIGLPGDEVSCCDTRGRLMVNGQPLDEQNYLFTSPDGEQVSPSEISFDVVVPADRIFVMGDHRDYSRDSRCHLNDEKPGTEKGDNAFVPMDLVVGRAFAVVWPLSSASRLRIPSTWKAVPPGRDPAPQQAKIDAGPDANC